MTGTVFAVALNHRSQLDAWRDAFQRSPYRTPPETPVWFIKPQNTVIYNNEAIPYPKGETVLSGATIGLVIGKAAKKVSVDDAENYIAGFRLANEVSLPETSFYRPAIKAKCRDGFCPLGEVAELKNIGITDVITEVNDREVDRWNTGDLVRQAAELVSALSEFTTLQPGDVILMGTPHKRVEINPGDRITLRAANLPVLENIVIPAGGF